MITTRRMQVRAVRPQRSERIVSLGADMLAALIGLASCYTASVVGDIPGSEFLLVLLAPILFAVRWGRILGGKRRVRILIFIGLWLVGQIATDIYRETALYDWARGDASIIFLGMDFICLAALLAHNERRKVIFICSFAIGGLLAPKIHASVVVNADPWKFGYSYPTMLMVILLSCYFFARRQYFITGLLFTGLIAINLAFNFRSPILMLMVTMVLILPIIPEEIGHFHILPPAGSKNRILVLVCIAMIGGGLAGFVVTGLSASGALGEGAKAKNESQSQNKFGILIGGRPEILVSTRAVIDSPILGHGSWAKDMKYVSMLADLLTEFGQPTDAESESDSALGLIPSHSHLMGSWVSAGILAVPFWFYVLGLTIKAIGRTSLRPQTLTPVYVFTLGSFVWDILFSPLGGMGRVICGFLLVFLLDILDMPEPAVRAPRISRLGQIPASRFRSRSRFHARTVG
jgi:hypothetical protein